MKIQALDTHILYIYMWYMIYMQSIANKSKQVDLQKKLTWKRIR